MNKNILNFLKSKNSLKVAVFGDSMVDNYFEVCAERISPEFPIPVLLSESYTPYKSLPGGAGHLANQLDLFSDVDLYSLVDDSFDFNNSENSVKISGAIPHKNRFYHEDFPLCRWDVEKNNYGISDHDLDIATDELCKNLSEQKYDVVLFSDYNKGIFSKVSFADLNTNNTKTVVDPKAGDLRNWIGCSVFKPNYSEALAFTGIKDIKEQCRYLLNALKCEHVVITNAGDGVVFNIGDDIFTREPIKPSVRSVVGAGDCFVAFLALAYGSGMSIENCVEISQLASSKYVERIHNELITSRDLLDIASPGSSKLVGVEFLKNRDFKLTATNGCYDLLHAGHLDSLNFAKSLGNKLVVAVNSDDSIKMNKGDNRPIVSLIDRIKILSALECVDYIVPFDSATPYDLYSEIRPDVLVKGEDWRGQSVAGAEFAKELVFHPLANNLSTSKIIDKVLKDA